MSARSLPRQLAMTLALALTAALAVAEPAESRPAGEAAAAEEAPDPALLDRLIAEGEVITERPRPSWTEYVGDALGSLGLGFAGWLEGFGDLDSLLNQAIRWLLILASAVLGALVVWLLIKSYERRALRRREEASAAVVDLSASDEAEVDWRLLLDERLEAGQAAAALEALWWLLAARLEVRGVDASWTTRELALRADRRDLLPAVRRFDRLSYSGRAFGGEDVRDLRDSLLEALGTEALGTEALGTEALGTEALDGEAAAAR
ncbi:MAG: hypothetical protein AAF725_10655 [Acidobacteriota bacterium]